VSDNRDRRGKRDPARGSAARGNPGNPRNAQGPGTARDATEAPGPRSDPSDAGVPKSRTGRTPSATGTGPGAGGGGAGGAGLSRRRLPGTATAAGVAGLVVGGGAGATAYAQTRPEEPAALTTVGSDGVPLGGAHQAGIATPLQAVGHLVAFDLAPGAGRDQAAALLRRWSRCAAWMAAGKALPTDATEGHDTAIALDAGPSSLTVTIGFGASFFDRTGLAHQRPGGLDPLPAFSSDHLDPARSNGDLWVQIGSDDALVAFHALRAMQKEAGSTARVRWQMNGFNRTPGTTPRPMTPRNLMGQVDGTGNPGPSSPAFAEHVFVPRHPQSGSLFGSPAWMANGSYAVVRRIRMLLDDWEKLPVSKQEKVIGRRKSDGAPLSGGTETTPMNLTRTGPDGELLIPADAHARIAAPDANSGATLLRRSFSYNDGVGRDGVPDAGLLFVCWQSHPLAGFVPVQRKLDRGDALSPYIRHEASGLFAVPGGPGKGEYVGQRLMES
jgi:dye decolorizing peroxidase